MKDLFSRLWSAASATNGPTRVVVGAFVVIALAIAGLFSLRAWNPSFVALRVELDSSELSAVSAAVASTGIRFKTSEPPGPYTLWVEEPRQYEALGAIYLAGALDSGPRGISAQGGAASVFLGSGERTQQLQKRKWEEVEQMLEVYKWISRATVTSSTPRRSPLDRGSPETISVVLQLRGVTEPDREQRETVAKIVSSAFGVAAKQVVVSDQYGHSIFDGSEDEGLDDVLTFQRRYDDEATDDVQRILDETYGVGMGTASVKSRWMYDQIESIDEAVDPTTKTPIAKTQSDSSTPQGGGPGGIAGSSANLLESGAQDAAAPIDPEALKATTSDLTEEYLVGRKTTHRVQRAPTLERLTVTVLVDESLSAELTGVEQWVKGVVGFDEARGDLFTAGTARFSGLERDEEGNPVTPEPEPLPEPPSAALELLLERGVEILAALAFLFVLLRSLKKSSKNADSVLTPAARGQGDADANVDPELLARRRVDDLLANDPREVSALLSRWAMEDEDSGVGAGR